MTNEPELLAELVKANETLAEIKGYARFSNQVLKIYIMLIILSIVVIALVFAQTI